MIDSADARIRVAILTPILAVLVVVVCAMLGALVGVLFLDHVGTGDDEGLGVVFAVGGGVLFGCLAGPIACGWFLTRRRPFPRGVKMLIGLWFPAGLVGGAIVRELAAQAGLSLLGVAVCIAVWVLLLLGIAANEQTQRRVRRVVVGVACAMVAAGAAVGPIAVDGYQASQYEEAGTPLAVIDEAELGATLPGWTIERYRRIGNVTFDRLQVELTTDLGGEVSLRIDTREFTCPSSVVCEEFGRLADGSPVTMVAGATDCRDGIQRPGSLVVVRTGGNWRLGPDTPCSDAATQPTIEQLERLLAAVDPVMPREFVRQVGAR